MMVKHALRLASIPSENYTDYRYEVIFGAYKWDPQVEDANTISEQVVLMEWSLARQLERWAEQLAQETMLLEEALLDDLSLVDQLGLPAGIKRELPRLRSYRRQDHVRLMRFDFHPTVDGWAVSEVNSDVPGGFAEASAMPQIALPYFPGYEAGRNVAQMLYEAFRRRLAADGTIAFVHATSYSDDRQVMQFLGDFFRRRGLNSLFVAPDHLQWRERRAYSIAEGWEGLIDGIVRFFPLEWLLNLPRSAYWPGYYEAQTPSCNHPIAMLTQSKRLPLLWDRLGVAHPVWDALLPETRDPRQISPTEEGWIYKPALGRVGERITIREVVAAEELKRIDGEVRRSPQNWLAQRRFQSQALLTEEGQSFHLCIGVFTVDGESAGFYGRINPYPHIDAKAKDIPILVYKEERSDEG